MKSYTNGRNQYGVWTKNTAAANLTDGDQEANSKYRHICAMKDWSFLERVRTLTTVASVQGVNLPYDCDLVREIAVIPTGSTIRYTPKLAPTARYWDELNLTPFTSNIPEWYFVRAGQILLWPTPTSSGNTIYVTQKTRVIDLQFADYTTGNIVSVASGATTVTGSGTTWTSQMVGRYIQITPSVANTGDGVWYEIASVTSSTILELVRAYGGNSIVAGSSAYTIGQMPLLPEAFHDTIWRLAAGTYWTKEVDERGPAFIADANADLKILIGSYSSPTTDMVLDSGQDFDILNPNLTITL